MHRLSLFALNGAEARREAGDAVSSVPDEVLQALVQLRSAMQVSVSVPAFPFPKISSRRLLEGDHSHVCC